MNIQALINDKVSQALEAAGAPAGHVLQVDCARVIESYILEVDCEIDGETLVAGTWMAKTEIDRTHVGASRSPASPTSTRRRRWRSGWPGSSDGGPPARRVPGTRYTVPGAKRLQS